MRIPISKAMSTHRVDIESALASDVAKYRFLDQYLLPKSKKYQKYGFIEFTNANHMVPISSEIQIL